MRTTGVFILIALILAAAHASDIYKIEPSDTLSDLAKVDTDGDAKFEVEPVMKNDTSKDILKKKEVGQPPLEGIAKKEIGVPPLADLPQIGVPPLQDLIPNLKAAVPPSIQALIPTPVPGTPDTPTAVSGAPVVTPPANPLAPLLNKTAEPAAPEESPAAPVEAPEQVVMEAKKDILGNLKDKKVFEKKDEKDDSKNLEVPVFTYDFEKDLPKLPKKDKKKDDVLGGRKML